MRGPCQPDLFRDYIISTLSKLDQLLFLITTKQIKQKITTINHTTISIPDKKIKRLVPPKVTLLHKKETNSKCKLQLLCETIPRVAVCFETSLFV